MRYASIESELEPTKTWLWRWYRATFKVGEFPARVRIQQKGKGKLADDETYWLDWDNSELQPGFKGFILTNTRLEPTPDRPGIYRVVIRSSTREVLSCSCKGSVCYRQSGCECKHKSVIINMIGRRVFDAERIEDIEGVVIL